MSYGASRTPVYPATNREERAIIALKNRSSRRQKQPVGMKKRVDTLLAMVRRATPAEETIEGTADLLIR